MQSFIAESLQRATGRSWEVQRIEPPEMVKLHTLFVIAVPPQRLREPSDYTLLSLLSGRPVYDHQIFIPEPAVMRTLALVGELAGPVAGDHVHMVVGSVGPDVGQVATDVDETFPDEASARTRLLAAAERQGATQVGPALFLLAAVGKWMRLRRCGHDWCSRSREAMFTPALIA